MDKSNEDVSKATDPNNSGENSPKNKSKTRGKKRKRIASGSSTDGDDVLPENTFEMEKNLHASAIKNNLDDVSVKKILKKVVTNDHVLALVKLREEEEDSGTEERLHPKLTRAKAKELMKASPNSVPQSSTELGTKPWNLELIPIKHIPVKTRPEVTALIAQELPEDEDDDEYEPTHDDVPSDDDHMIESSSDVDSLPRTPKTPKSLKKDSPKVVQDGPFKVPQEITSQVRRQLNLEEEATIALRTRSKLSLSATPIEHIESSFIPPDELPMADVDDLWSEFLNECLNPVSNVRHEDDDETDPEYNVAADPDAREEDEDLQLLKISKKELSDLVNELFQVMPDSSEDQLMQVLDNGKNKEINASHWEGKQEPISDEDTASTSIAARLQFEQCSFSIGKTEPEDVPENDSVAVTSTDARVPQKVTMSVEETEETLRPHTPSPPSPHPPAALRCVIIAPKPQTVQIEVDDTVKLHPEQLLILQQQLRQHIQLATSHFLQLYVHPTLWSYAPKFKEYLVQLNEKTIKEPKSVVNVCNLKAALGLVESWEKSLSENTPDSMSMVEFLQKEVEKCRRRTSQNATYCGEFHDLFKEVVANSSVFLYPYLLPPVPFRADFTHKRFRYMKSEDELIVLGLDQFWQYIEMNPEIFKPPRVHPRQRWGLSAAVRLVCKHMMPWLTTRALMLHIMAVRKHQNSDTPISRYFKKNEIEPVKHKLLPFNPKLTLYEHPEFEMPRIWIKYLGKSSKRFRDHYYRRTQTLSPAGVEVEIGKNIETAKKAPLPIDFTKEISSNRINLLQKVTEPAFVDKVDVHIQKSIAPSSNNSLVATNLYQVINTSLGMQLIPLQIQTNTVNSTTTPICTPAVIGSTKGDSNIDTNKIDESIDKRAGNKEDIHCKCCILLRKIVKKRQTCITDYFNFNKKDIDCGCINKKYPVISNKLRILVNNFKTHSSSVHDALLSKIVECKGRIKYLDKDISKTNDFNSKDLVSALSFHIKLLQRCSLARNSQIRKSVHTAFSKFNVFSGHVLELAEHLYKVFNIELADMYKEFTGFLTAEQADKMDVFNDYFVRNCVEDLVAKVEEQVPDSKKRCKILEGIKKIFTDKLSQPCDVCCKLLLSAKEFPKLGEYIYSLFPHRRRVIKNSTQNSDKLVNGNVEKGAMEKEINETKGMDKNSIELDDVQRQDNDKGEVEKENTAKENKETENMEIDDVEKENMETENPENVAVEKGDIDQANAERDKENEDSNQNALEKENTEKVVAEEEVFVLNGENINKENPKKSDAEKDFDGEDIDNEEDTLTICEETDAAMDNEVIELSSDGEDGEHITEETLNIKVEKEMVPSPQTNLQPRHAFTIIKKRNENTLEITFTEMKSPQESCDTTYTSTIEITKEDSMKTELQEWRREEDKIILEILKQCFTPEQMKDKTIIDIIDDKNLLNMILQNLTHKTMQDVRDRILYLLKILVSNENNK